MLLKISKNLISFFFFCSLGQECFRRLPTQRQRENKKKLSNQNTATLFQADKSPGEAKK